MDLTKAQRLINKIQAFLDDGAHELSRLEKDLIKSYVLQLYEAVTSDDSSVQPEIKKSIEPVSHRVHREETSAKHDPSFSKPHESKSETKQETFKPEIIKPDPAKEESFKPSYTEYKPVEKTENAYSEYIPPVIKQTSPDIQTSVAEVTGKIQPEESKTYYNPVTEPEKEISPSLKQPASTGEGGDPITKLFDLQKTEESRFGHVQISSIESAMGLNERIFTLNELFGGDKGMFDAWCDKLNSLNSFAEAKQVLINGPAKDFKWTEPQRLKMAEQFIRIVSRRYPKSGN